AKCSWLLPRDCARLATNGIACCGDAWPGTSTTSFSRPCAKSLGGAMPRRSSFPKTFSAISKGCRCWRAPTRSVIAPESSSSGTKQAWAQRARAERRFNDVRKLARDLMLDVHDSIQYLPGATPARKLIIQDALEYVDSLAKESSGDPSLQRELAIAYEKVGDVQGWDVRSNLGDTAGALQSFRKSLAIRQALAHDRPNDSQARSDLAEGYTKVGDVLLQTGDKIEALKNLDQALEIRKQLAAAAPGDKGAQLNLAIAYDGIANALADQNQLDLSLENTRQSLTIFAALLAADPADRRYRRNVALEQKKVGGIYEATGKLNAALEEYQKALPVDEALAAENPNDALAQRDLAIDYANVG